MHFNDPLCMPRTGEEPAERFLRAAHVAGTAAEEYLHRRKIPVSVAEAASVRFDADFAGRPAVLAPLIDETRRLASLHGRYLHVRRWEGKMLTVGAGGGVIEMPCGLQAEQPILVEGLFDALSLSACGWPCVATIGRWAPWLTGAWAGKTVWLAFDCGRPGEAEVDRYARRLTGSTIRRLPPPPRCKDWNTALVKRGSASVGGWVRQSLVGAGAEA
jgi:hypothetical protein